MTMPILAKMYHYFASLCGAYVYGFPGKKIYVIGVTGTKGKSTTLELLNSILEAAGEKTALLSSVRIKVAGESVPNDTENTMPGGFFIQRFLRRAVQAGCTAALIEVTSQGTVLSRHRFISWDVGVLTNLAPEHTEAHGSFEAYRDAKVTFLDYVLRKQGTIFINQHDPNSRFFIEVFKDRKITVLFSRENAHMQSLLSRPSLARKPKDSLPEFMLTDFNKDNIAAAEAVTRHLGVRDDLIEDGVRNFRGVPGRMEFLEKNGITAIIDYAHTPESLEAVYKAIKGWANDRELATGSRKESSVKSPKLICVLGSAGGGRDVWKRPVLGEIASRYCDKIILTDEDSYDEDSRQIVSEILSGVTSDKRQATTEILDRAEAIRQAVALAEKGDVVVTTGKGSEQWIHGPQGSKTPWSERQAVENALGIQ